MQIGNQIDMKQSGHHIIFWDLFLIEETLVSKRLVVQTTRLWRRHVVPRIHATTFGSLNLRSRR
jgi:hypothetical protein